MPYSHPDAVPQIVKTEAANFHEEVIQGLLKLQQNAQMITDRLQRVITRAFGEGPTNAGNNSPKAVPSGSTGVIKETIENLVAETAQQSVLISRIDEIL